MVITITVFIRIIDFFTVSDFTMRTLRVIIYKINFKFSYNKSFSIENVI